MLIHRRVADRVSVYAALLTATLAHAAPALQLPRPQHTSTAAASASSPVVVDVEVPPPPPAPVVEDRPPPVAQNVRGHATTPKVDAAPVQAQAAAVLTRTSDPNEPVDMTDSFVVGEAATYAGGTTSSRGMSTTAIHGSNKTSQQPERVSSRGNGTASDGGVDHSRRALMLGGTEWKCPFPPEADADSVDHATVTVRIGVDANGAPLNVTVVRDAGRGFGREARRCALEKRFEPALDQSGLPRAGTVTINVHFDR
jgi:periplasmic protein TonB